MGHTSSGYCRVLIGLGVESSDGRDYKLQTQRVTQEQVGLVGYLLPFAQRRWSGKTGKGQDSSRRCLNYQAGHVSQPNFEARGKIVWDTVPQRSRQWDGMPRLLGPTAIVFDLESQALKEKRVGPMMG